MMTNGGSPRGHVASDVEPCAAGHAGDPEAIFIISQNAVDCPLGDGLALFDARCGASFTLNRTGAIIWNSARQRVSFREMRAILATACKGAPDDIDADLHGIVDALVESGMFVIVTDARAEADSAYDV
ncbi:MAG: PqqD family protein [Sphingobium sp.]|nr:PqqD family protein [Sphingobium sp.]MBP6111536.1 PqqD family protein [Sphingobium sp.]MBP8670535.1 PqqD family protein [Sphingobium sp.]MBP9157268.1 PqqD family protein [Sphingobium sp.]MCC6483089.1 PqqD family protein [Sphingomonadaceae bacterium]